MSLNPQDKSAVQYSLPEAGVVPARCARVVEIGEHDTKYGVKDQVVIWYGLPSRIIEDEGDYQGKQYMIRTAPMKKSSSDKASLMEHVNCLYAPATSLDQLLDKPCFVTIIHNEVESGDQSRTYANISQVSGVPEGIPVGELDTTPFYFDFEAPDEDIWTEKLWDGIREQITNAENYAGSAVEEMVLRLAAMKAG